MSGKGKKRRERKGGRRQGKAGEEKGRRRQSRKGERWEESEREDRK